MLAAYDSGKQGGTSTPSATPTAASTSAAPAGSTALATARPGAASARSTEPITFSGPEGHTPQSAWSAAEKPRGAVLVIHENRGLTDYIRGLAGRFAGAGYSLIALDLLSEASGTRA
jgi:carboxymethylenebutenolidase